MADIDNGDTVKIINANQPLAGNTGLVVLVTEDNALVEGKDASDRDFRQPFALSELSTDLEAEVTPGIEVEVEDEPAET